MLSTINRTVNLSAQSTFDGNVAVYMSANLRTGETPNITTAYKDVNLYQANEEQADADYAEFRDKVFEMANEG